MRCFSEAIDDLDLKYLPLSGDAFTWTSGLNNGSTSKLDHFLVSKDRENHFNGLCWYIIPRLVLDHSLILLDGGGMRTRKIHFCFENM